MASNQIAATERVNAGAGIITRLFRSLKVKSGEGRPMVMLGAALFAVQAGYWLGGNGVDALLAVRLNPLWWPYLFIGKAVIAIIAFAAYSYWLNRINKIALLTATSGIIVVALIIAWVVLRLNPPDYFYFLLYLYYVVPDLLSLQAWGLAGEVFDSRQGKRLYPLINAGDTVGILLGNFLTPVLSGLLGVEQLLLVWAGFVSLAFYLMYRLRRQLASKQKLTKPSPTNKTRRLKERQQSFWATFRLSYTIVRYYPLMWLLALTTCFSTMLYWTLWVNNIFVSKEQFKNNPGDLAGFFGIASGLAFLTAFFIGLFINRLFTRFGVRNFVVITPTINVIGYSVIALSYGFWPVVATRFFQQVSRQAISGSANKTLYNLVPPEARDVAQAFNDGYSTQIGFVGAGLLLLFFQLIGLSGSPFLFVVGVIIAVIYLYTAWRMRGLYRTSLVQLLKEGQQEFFQTADSDQAAFGDPTGKSDEALQVAINGLRDSSEGTRRLSAELLGKMGDLEGVRPLLQLLTTDQSPEVRRTIIVALNQLKAPEAYPSIAEALQDFDASVRAEAAAALRDSPNGIDRISFFFLRKALTDPSPVVRREAVLTMIKFGQEGEAYYVLWAMGRDKISQVRREASVAYGILANKTMLREVSNLMQDDDPTVRKQAATSLGNFDSNKAVQVLMYALEDENPQVREEAALSLGLLRHRSGSVLVRYLIETKSMPGQAAALQALSSAKMEENKRLAALSGIGSDEETDGQMTNISTGLVHHQHNKTPFALGAFDEQRLLEYGQKQLEIARRMREYIYILTNLDLESATRRSRVKRDAANLSLLMASLEERYQNALARLIKVVGLMGNVEAISLAATSLHATGKNAHRQRADAIEAIENFGDSRLTPGLIQLLEVEEQNFSIFSSKASSLVETLVEIWLEGDEWLRACVLHVAGLFDLQRMRSLVEQVLLIEADPEPWVYEAATDALQRLDYPRNDVEESRLLETIIREKDMQTLGTLSTMSRILFLQKVPLFASLSPEDLRRIALVSKERLFAPGEIICYEGDEGDELYIIVTGKVQIITGYGGANVTGVAGGSGRTLSIAGDGEALGEMAILDDIPRSATLRAYNAPVRLLTLNGDEFKRILRERPELAVEVIRILSRSLRETNRRIQDATTVTPLDTQMH